VAGTKPDAGESQKGDSVKSQKEKMSPDVLVNNAGTLFTFCPLTARAKEWIAENVQSEGYQWLGATLCVEHRYAWGLAQGMKDAGLVLE
jgi:hypothetical protein